MFVKERYCSEGEKAIKVKAIKVKAIKVKVFSYFGIITGVTLMAASVMVFFQPNDVVMGGVSGLCMIIASYLKSLLGVDISLSILNFAFNLPLLIAGYIILGKSFIWRTIFATVYYSAALAFTAYLPQYKGDYIIVAVFGGVIMGAGVGLTMRGFASTGGSDLFAAIVHKLKKDVSIANAMFSFDAVVIVIGFLVFGVECGLYAIMSIYISSKVVDGILEGLNFSVCAIIISQSSDKIAEDIMKIMRRGVTGLNGTGMYTHADMNVLLCTVAKKEILTLKDIVNTRDKNAFMIITNVKEALGEGFSAY